MHMKAPVRPMPSLIGVWRCEGVGVWRWEGGRCGGVREGRCGGVREGRCGGVREGRCGGVREWGWGRESTEGGVESREDEVRVHGKTSNV